MKTEVGKRHSCRLFGSEPSALSRRDFGRGLAAILAAGVAPAVLAGGLRRGLAARCATAGAGKLTAKNYVQDGLICIWDAIENVDWRSHEENPSVWKDLVGSRDATPTEGVAFLENKVVFSTGAKATFATALGGPQKTQEYVAAFPNLPNLNRQIQIGVFNSSAWGGANKPFMHPWFGVCNSYIKKTTIAFDEIKKTNVYSQSSESSHLNGAANDGAVYNDSAAGYGNCIGSETNQYTMELGCIRIYSRVLSDGEVLNNYLVDRERFGLP